MRSARERGAHANPTQKMYACMVVLGCGGRIHVSEHEDAWLMVHLVTRSRKHSKSDNKGEATCNILNHNSASGTQSALPTGASWKLRPKSLQGAVFQARQSCSTCELPWHTSPGGHGMCLCYQNLRSHEHKAVKGEQG